MERPLMIISKIFGLSVSPRNKNSKWLTKFQIYQLLSIIYFFTVFVYRFKSIQSKAVVKCKSICRLAECSGQIIVFIAYAICVLRNVFNQNIFGKYQLIMSEIDKDLKCCFEGDKEKQKNNKMSKEYRFQLIMLVIGFIFFTIVFSFDMYFYYFEGNILWFILFIFWFDPPYVVICLTQAQFISLIHSITSRYNKLNQILECICEGSDNKNENFKVFNIETSDHLNNDKKCLKNSQFNKNDLTAEKRNNAERFLVTVFKVHNKLCELGVITNSAYSLQIVSYMTYTFVFSIFSVFLSTKVIFLVGGKNHWLDIASVSYSLWTAYYVMIGYFVLRTCNHSQKESKRSILLIHEIMQKKPSFMLGNDIYYNKMKSFTLQYMHWENYFHYNGIGLFNLDYTFIFSTVSAATSYLIVLLQFDVGKFL